MEVRITVDTREAESFFNDLQKQQIPFALAKTLNASMVDAQKAVRGAAYSSVFTVRNRSLGKALTTIPRGHWASKHKPRVSMMNVKDAGTGFYAGAGFIIRQIKGAHKQPKGQHIAIPVIGPGLKRLKGGSIGRTKKPRAMGDKLVKLPAKGKRSEGLYQRMRGDRLVKRYNLVQSARPNRKGRFRYFRTADKTLVKVMGGHWRTQMNRAMATARPR